MSRNGQVADVTKIVNNGPGAKLWDLVILGDGFLKEDLLDYRSVTDRFVERLFSTSPFDEFRSVFNIHRVDVISDERGASDLIQGIRRATYFDSAFGANELARLLVTDQTLALETAADVVPEMNAALLIVNSLAHGGSGGTVPVFSCEESASEIALHEMGHGHFHLADEYENYSGDPDSEPLKFADAERSQKNVTATLDPLKWDHLMTPGYPIPTRRNSCCLKAADEQPALPDGVVGAFEGAIYHQCGVYRPSDKCRMRMLGLGFCPVCQDAIRHVLTPYRPPAPARRRSVRSR